MDPAQSRIKAQHFFSFAGHYAKMWRTNSFQNQSSNRLQADGPDMLDFAHSWNGLLGKMRSKSSHKSSALVQILGITWSEECSRLAFCLTDVNRIYVTANCPCGGRNMRAHLLILGFGRKYWTAGLTPQTDIWTMAATQGCPLASLHWSKAGGNSRGRDSWVLDLQRCSSTGKACEWEKRAGTWYKH